MMSPGAFPDPLTYEFPRWIIHEGTTYPSLDVIAWGLPTTVENLREAYTKGIFPWPHPYTPLPWFCPRERAILKFGDVTVPRSLAKERRKNRLTFSIDRDFQGVIEGCAYVTRDRSWGESWISPTIIRDYCDLHAEGMAHSVEAWDATGELAGGLYGVDAGGVFCGESMFFRIPNASKLALLFLIDHLRSRGSTWLDIQVMTDHMEARGAKVIDRYDFLNALKATQALKLSIF